MSELPGYDKGDNYWDEVDKMLLEKPMYQSDIRRKNRIGNLKLMMVKELPAGAPLALMAVMMAMTWMRIVLLLLLLLLLLRVMI